LFRLFEGRTADEVWRNVIAAFSNDEPVAAQASRDGPTREIIHSAISVSDPRQRWVVSRNPPMNLPFALAEVIWIMTGRNDSGFLNYFNSELPKYCGSGPTYHGAYGQRLRRHLGIDQLERAYEVLSKNPETRQLVLQIWDSRVDFPSSKGQPASPDVPCNIVAMLKVRDGALEWTQIMRSNDVFRGLPYNFVQFTTMQEIIAGWLNLNVGTYNQISDSLHVYDRDFHQISSSQSFQPSENTDSLSLSKRDFDLVLSELERQANAIIDETATAEGLISEIEESRLPSSYRNILCVLSAEGSRRRKQPQAIDEIMSHCTNPAFRQLFTRWLLRFRKDP
jgi:thymidylate synthase